jgi:GDP-4-dehydro-6-deoxy-D-mannose reductase
LTKRQAEGIAEHFASRELHCVIARPFNHAGPGQSPLFVLPSFARQVAEAEAGLRAPSLAVGNLDAVRDFSDVRDVVRAYRLLALKGERGGLYNIASGQGRSIRSALDGLLAKARIPIAVNVDTARLRSHDAAAIVGDAAKLRARTGWTPQIPFEKTLDDLLEDARAEAARVKAAPHPA